MKLITRLLLLLMVNTFIPAAVMAEPTREELEKWFNDDSQLHPEEQDSNTGQLVFLAKPPAKPAPHSTHQLTVTPASINTGWISIEQCHINLDAIEAVEVVYRYQQMRNLKIQSTQHIGKAWVEGQSIQLTDVQKGAELCARLEAHVFYQDDKGNYFLVNGPFQRRFFDSYFPMHLSLSVIYPHRLLRFSNVHPARQTGFNVTSSKNRIDIDTWFEGKLVIGIEFEKKP
jgi:hypothetical protein